MGCINVHGQQQSIKQEIIIFNPTECPICFEYVEQEHDYIILLCNHTYHCNCIMHWFEYKHNCPKCRMQVQYS